MAASGSDLAGVERWEPLISGTFSRIEGYMRDVVKDYPACLPDNHHVWGMENTLPQQPGDSSRLLQLFKDIILDEGVQDGPGGMLAGFNPNGGNIASTLGELYMLTAGLHKNAAWRKSVETILRDFCLDMIGYDDRGDVMMTSGGSISTVVSIMAARDALKITPTNVKRCVVYMTRTVHNCMDKALSVVGLGDIIIRHVKVNDQRKADCDDLKKHIQQDIQAGLRPVMVVGTAGDVQIGAVDPLLKLGDIAASHNMWYHVDAAYGGVYLLCEEGLVTMKGITMADSVIVCFHKSIFQPFGCSCVMFKDGIHKQHMESLLQTRANAWSTLVEETPPMREFYIWFSLISFGTKRMRRYIKEKLELTSYLYREMQLIPGLTTPCPPQLTKIVFAVYGETPEEADNLTEALCQALNGTCELFVNTTELWGRVYIHMCISNLRTHIEEIQIFLHHLKNQMGMSCEINTTQGYLEETFKKITIDCIQFEQRLSTSDDFDTVFKKSYNLINYCQKDDKTTYKPSALSLTEQGHTLEEVLEIIKRQHMSHGSLDSISPAEIPSLMAHFLISATNRYSSIRAFSKAHVELELWLIKWFAGILGLPPSSSGVLCNDVYSADILCVLTARCTLLRQSDMYNRAVVYASSTVLASFGPVLHLLGLGQCAQQCVTAEDQSGNVIINAVYDAIQKTTKDNALLPFMVILTGEEVNSPDMKKLVSLCRQLGVWIHLSIRKAASLVLGDLTTSKLMEQSGLREANSVSMDLTEAFCQPQSQGVALVSKAHQLQKAVLANRDATYFRDIEHTFYESSIMSIELTRPGRQVPLWFALYSLGAVYLKKRLITMAIG